MGFLHAHDDRIFAALREAGHVIVSKDEDLLVPLFLLAWWLRHGERRAGSGDRKH